MEIQARADYKQDIEALIPREQNEEKHEHHLVDDVLIEVKAKEAH